jgi:hypothetical protein
MYVSLSTIAPQRADGLQSGMTFAGERACLEIVPLERQTPADRDPHAASGFGFTSCGGGGEVQPSPAVDNFAFRDEPSVLFGAGAWMALLIEFGSFILIPNGALPAFLRILGCGFASRFVFLFCNHPTRLLLRLSWELAAAPLVPSDFSNLDTSRRPPRPDGKGSE